MRPIQTTLLLVRRRDSWLLTADSGLPILKKKRNNIKERDGNRELVLKGKKETDKSPTMKDKQSVEKKCKNDSTCREGSRDDEEQKIMPLTSTSPHKNPQPNPPATTQATFSSPSSQQPPPGAFRQDVTTADLKRLSGGCAQSGVT